MAKTIPLTRGMSALVDDDDYELLSGKTWYAIQDARSGSWYARYVAYENGKKISALMHRFLMAPPDGVEVDHVNGNGLDNRRENIRIATKSQNMFNAKKRRGTKSRYKGLTAMGGGFRLRVSIDGRQIDFGTYSDETHAARIYDAIAVITRGAFAHTNFPELDPAATEDAKRLLKSMPTDGKYEQSIGSFSLPERHLDWVAQRAARLGTSKSAVVKEALENLMADDEKEAA